jgi:lipopolysaccharide export system permease protein
MSIFTRYVLRQSAGALLLILLSLSGIVWIALALRELNVVTTQGQDALKLIKMTTLALPNLMAIIAPFALLIASIHTLNRLSGDSELIVLTAAGGTLSTVARPLLALAVAVSLFVTFVNHFAMPWSLRELRGTIVEMRADLLSQVIQPGRFSSPEANLTFHIRERDISGELRGIIMHDTRDATQNQTYLAERGVIVKQPPAAYLVMSEGHILRRSSGKEAAQIIAFDKYAVDLARFQQKEASDGDLKPRERYYSELVVPPDPKTPQARQAGGQIRAELHERFASALYPFAFVLIAVASVGQAQSTRQNRGEKAVIGFIAAVGLRMAGLAVNNLVVVKAGYVPLLYALPLVAAALAVVSVLRGARPRRGSGRFGDLHDAVVSWVAARLRIGRADGMAGGSAP